MSDLKPGDVLLWKDDEWTLQVGKKVWRIPIPTPIFVHADLYIGSGKVRTSIQGKGSSTSTIRKRQKQFIQGIVVRVTEKCNMDRVVKSAKGARCKYCWGGYYGQYLDVFVSPNTFPIPDFSSKSDWWTDKLASRGWEYLYCSEFCAACFLPLKLAGKLHRLTSPQDIYEYAKRHKKKRKILNL